MDISILYQENARPEEIQAIRNGVLKEADAANMGQTIPFTFLIKDSTSRILAGATGATMYGYIHIDWLWVDPAYRSKRWGSQLLKAIEKLGKERKCSFSCVFTMSWEAFPFYQKHGYQIEFVREGLINQAKVYFLRKNL